MNKYQRSRFNRGNVENDYLKTVALEIIQSMPNFFTWWQTFQNCLTTISTFLQIQDDFLPAFQANKKQVRASLTNEALTLAAILQSFANATNNPTLFQRMNIKKSFLEKLSSVDFIAVCKNIKDTANALIDDLPTYGVTPVTMLAYTSKIDSYISACSIPANAKLAKKEATRQIAVKLDEADDLLGKMAGDAFIIRILQPLFFKKFTDAKKLVDPPTVPQSATGEIVDQNGEPIPFAKVFSKELGINRKSTKKGTFIFKNLPEGIWDITYSSPGFQDITKSVTIAEGRRPKIQIALRPVVEQVLETTAE